MSAFSIYSRIRTSLQSFVLWVPLMVLILDGNSENVAKSGRKIGFDEEKIRFVTPLKVIKCLKEIK